MWYLLLKCHKLHYLYNLRVNLYACGPLVVLFIDYFVIVIAFSKFIFHDMLSIFFMLLSFYFLFCYETCLFAMYISFCLTDGNLMINAYENSHYYHHMKMLTTRLVKIRFNMLNIYVYYLLVERALNGSWISVNQSSGGNKDQCIHCDGKTIPSRDKRRFR